LEGLKQEAASLIEKAQNGDAGAFEEIVRRHGPRIQAIAYQMSGDSDDARDITQEVFVRLLKSLGQFNADYSFATWLYRLTVNLSIDFLRKNARYRHKSIEASEVNMGESDNGPRPDENLERKEFCGAIREVTQELSINQRRVFVLRDLQGFSTEEVAAILKCRISTVRVHLARARGRIKETMLEKYPETMEVNRR